MRVCKKCNLDISNKRSDAIFCGKKCKKDHWHRCRYPVPAKRLTDVERKLQNKKHKLNWQVKNREKFLKNRREYSKNRYDSDIHYKLCTNLRNRLSEAIKNGQKAGSAVSDLGCSIAKLKIYLQLKFHRNPRDKHEYMSWEYRSKWHIDHIIPLSSFDLSDPMQLKEACHYTNLQPMWARDNIVKGASFT